MATRLDLVGQRISLDRLGATAGLSGSAGVCAAVLLLLVSLDHAGAAEKLTIAVLDPLSAKLACPCVAGYAQRKYERLAEYLTGALQRPINVVYGNSLPRAVQDPDAGQIGLVVGKHSLVQFDALHRGMKIRPVAQLTGLDGKTDLTGWFVVAQDDPARRLADLKGYHVILGTIESAEKHGAAVAALKSAGVELPAAPDTRPECTQAAVAVLEHKGPSRAAAVVSSYAMALLEGCGSVPKGSLRVVGRTEPVPFVTVFATDALPAPDEAKLVAALLRAKKDARLLKTLESRDGFVRFPPAEEKKPENPKKKGTTSSIWPGWRGPQRDGTAPWLPDRLPKELNIVWEKRLTGNAMAGLAATERYILVADKDGADQRDIFRCLDADSGRQLWKIEYPAVGKMDYGNAPRATPLVDGQRVFFLSAFGDLHCVNLADGRIHWKQNLVAEYGASLVTWGMCSSPLVVDGRLIVNPGAPDASLVALEPESGKGIWKTPGGPAAYASFIVATLGARRQIVGYDAQSLGGWDIASGRRLWTLVPPEKNDFNVPTPVVFDGKLIVTTENNGARLYAFDSHGSILPEPVAKNDDLRPDTNSPLVASGRVLGCHGDLMCLDPRRGLKIVWDGCDPAFSQPVTMIAAGHRVLVCTIHGELLLLDAAAERYQVISRLPLFDNDAQVISHPALVGKRLYVRGDRTIACVLLE